MKKRLVLGERDIGVLDALHLHGALNMRQLAELCFGEVSSETARKRLRKLHQSGYIGATVTSNKEEKGRPEHLYFLTAQAAGALARNKNIAEKSIIIGPPNNNHKEHLTRLVELHLAWKRTAKHEKISDCSFLTKRVSFSNRNGDELVNAAKGHADAVITFNKGEDSQQTILIVLETGNLRQTRHWQPKINAFTKTNIPVLMLALDERRLDTLRQWTLPMLKDAGVCEDRYLFGLYDEVVMKGFVSTIEFCNGHSKVSAK